MNHSIVDISSLTMLEACYNHSFQFFFISFHENAMIKTTKQYKFNICFPQSNEQVDVMTMNILQHLLLFNSTEALAGLSLVAVIVHFIDFGTKIVVCLNELEVYPGRAEKVFQIQEIPKTIPSTPRNDSVWSGSGSVLPHRIQSDTGSNPTPDWFFAGSVWFGLNSCRIESGKKEYKKYS